MVAGISILQFLTLQQPDFGYRPMPLDHEAAAHGLIHSGFKSTGRNRSWIPSFKGALSHGDRSFCLCQHVLAHPLSPAA